MRCISTMYNICLQTGEVLAATRLYSYTRQNRQLIEEVRLVYSWYFLTYSSLPYGVFKGTKPTYNQKVVNAHDTARLGFKMTYLSFQELVNREVINSNVKNEAISKLFCKFDFQRVLYPACKIFKMFTTTSKNLLGASSHKSFSQLERKINEGVLPARTTSNIL